MKRTDLEHLVFYEIFAANLWSEKEDGEPSTERVCVLDYSYHGMSMKQMIEENYFHSVHDVIVYLERKGNRVQGWY